MSGRIERAVSRLKRLAAKSSDGDSGMSVNSMIEAVVGPGYDQELEALVSMALSSSSEAMDLDQIAIGILSIEDWRVENS
jgi:hypothetical protein|tara:strand:+ start:370 stop:609 length:240 start_codon:yes stop_codon:yes gene_type:complete